MNMDTIQNKTVAGTTAIKKNTSDKRIVSYIPQFIKPKDISFFLWRLNYQLEESRQEHASLGHLWRQVGCCIALSIFRIIGRAL